MVLKRYPRISVAVLCVSLFTLGYFREQMYERERVQTLVESSAQADKNFQELMAACELRLNTVHAMVALALKHKITVPSALVLVLDGLDEQPSVADSQEMQEYQNAQMQLSSGVHDLIAAMDGELNPADTEFKNLFHEFQAEEQNLDRIQSNYDLQFRRVRALARKGDRQFLSPGIRLPATVEENL